MPACRDLLKLLIMVPSIWILLIVAWLISGLLELAASYKATGALSKLAAMLALALNAISTGMMIGKGFNLLAILFLALAFYRLVNIARIFAGRLEKHNLRRASVRAALALLLAQLAIIAASYYWPSFFTSRRWLLVLAASQLVVALAFLASLVRQIKNTRFSRNSLRIGDHDLPTLTVAIPAKNETSDLEDCLGSLLASDYPKLEVLVLDDSAGSKTGEIIRALAHDGVRFILGDDPGNSWLAKNLAYDRLAREANGEIVLFCGVDVRFGRSSLRSLVLEMLARKKLMMSVMPQNRERLSLTQPMRYFWELARPRFGASRPVLSTCWLAQRDFLLKAGGLASVKREIIPERHFASLASANNDRYEFVRAGGPLELNSVKSVGEQRATAIRTRYPLLHRRLASVAGVSLFEAGWLLAPLALIIILPFYGWSLAAEALSALAVIIWLIVYAVIIRISFGARALLAPLFWLAVLTDVLFVNLSLIKYEFGKVLWKGRNVAVPAGSLQHDRLRSL